MFLICVMNGASYPQTVSYYFLGGKNKFEFQRLAMFPNYVTSFSEEEALT